MADRLVKFLSHVDMVKIMCVETTNLVEEARKIHNLNPTPTAALGRTLTMATMMGAMQKEEDGKITIQIIGNGPLGKIIVSANNRSEVKGCVDNPLAEAPLNEKGKLNVSAIVGQGQLNVIKDIGLKEPYVGNVPLQTGEIAEDFAYYYAVSEQIPTAVALGVLVNQDGSVKKAGGYIIQATPDTPEEILKLIENRIAESDSMTQMLEKGMTLEEIAIYISDDLNTYAVEECTPIYQCDCSKERMERALLCLSKNDIMDLANDDVTEICCHFCNKKYQFSKAEMLKLHELK
ncbi:MAG: Hsp33 family molecular chaperone HslO [Clostridia bacterium]|nr:Hsp33 family molecular chaperone HslO [Clostridia bacterium]